MAENAAAMGKAEESARRLRSASLAYGGEDALILCYSAALQCTANRATVLLSRTARAAAHLALSP